LLLVLMCMMGNWCYWWDRGELFAVSGSLFILFYVIGW